MARARPVLAKQRHRLRKRYAALLAALLIPAIAGAAEWPAATPAANLKPAYSPLARAGYTAPFGVPAIHSDAQDHALAGDATVGPAARTPQAAISTMSARSNA